MAPVKISHIVSFSSQDPRYPVENLLCPDGHQPWLSCPQERSRQLRVELQLERAVPIGYIDVGNWGCAFLQIDVGRSSWPLDRPYLTLVPSVALMTPADSKLDRNRCGVRMFKEGSFSTALLPAHASRCGEEDSDCELELLPSASSLVQCPICGLCFGAAEVEQHCSTCGE
ncbi:hypothetical protein ASZ78_013794 [Callipepla squamata]|uniref:DNA-repair protein Xrcc1 N-terminal domain-containing protein n=1 Tax=Callipepla squamata TaxID=9009 RepID=A0A226N562_CALSU|nr:hypothetical protein ASZ78_013794 [Callipepla squamata]